MKFGLLHVSRACVLRAWILGVCGLVPISSLALELSFDEAQQRLFNVSDAIAGSQSQLESRQHLAEASDSLSYPEVTLDVKLVVDGGMG